jgi:hypothetical protein
VLKELKELKGLEDHRVIMGCKVPKEDKVRKETEDLKELKELRVPKVLLVLKEPLE